MTEYSQHIEWAKRELKGNEQLYHEEKSKIIKELAERLSKDGMPDEMISAFITEQLEGYASARIVRNALEEKYKEKSKVRKSTDVSGKVPQITVRTDGSIENSDPPKEGSKELERAKIVMPDLENDDIEFLKKQLEKSREETKFEREEKEKERKERLQLAEVIKKDSFVPATKYVPPKEKKFEFPEPDNSDTFVWLNETLDTVRKDLGPIKASGNTKVNVYMERVK